MSTIGHARSTATLEKRRARAARPPQLPLRFEADGATDGPTPAAQNPPFAGTPTMARTYPTVAFKNCRIFWIRGAVTPEVKDRLVGFWLDNDAIEDRAEADRRVAEVGCIVVNEQAEIVGVNTLFVHPLTDGRPYWFYRTFVRPDSRTAGLSSAVFKFTAKKLAAAPRDADAPLGIVVVAENPKLARPGGRRRLERLGLRSIGTGPRGNEIWVLDFDAAQPSPASTV
jgi:hypothetical protein